MGEERAAERRHTLRGTPLRYARQLQRASSDFRVKFHALWFMGTRPVLMSDVASRRGEGSDVGCRVKVNGLRRVYNTTEGFVSSRGYRVEHARGWRLGFGFQALVIPISGQRSEALIDHRAKCSGAHI